MRVNKISKIMAMDFFYRAAGTILAPFIYAQREIKDATEDLKEDAQEALSKAIKIAAMGLFGIFFLLFASVSGAMAINDAMDSTWTGFAIIGGLYLIVVIGIYIWYKASVRKPEHQYKHRQATSVPVHG
jgi:hypothetical protein